MTTSLDYLPKSIFLVSLLALYIFCTGLWCLFSPVALYAEDSPAQVELGPYDTIVTKDPFDPERGKKEDLTGDNSSSAETDLKSRYQVYGTIIVGGIRMAYLKVTNSKSGPFIRNARDKGKNIRTVRPGDLVDGWSVKDITSRGVVFRSRRGESVQIGIFDTAKKGRSTGAPVAFQAPQPRSYIRPIPGSRSAKRASTGLTESGSGPFHLSGNKKASQGPKIFGPAKASIGPGLHAETKGTAGAPNQPKFFAPPASPGGQGRPNPFLELLKRASEGRQ